MSSTNQPGKPRVKFIDETGTDTTEGHLARGRGGFEEADTEGHGIKFRGVTEAGDDDSSEGHQTRGKG